MYGIDPKLALQFFLVMCGLGIGLIVGALLGFAEGRHARLRQHFNEMGVMWNRLMKSECDLSISEAKRKLAP